MSFKIKWIDNNPIVLFEGNITLNDIRLVDGKIYGDSRFDVIKSIIYNFSEVKSLNINIAELNLISYIDKSASRNNENMELAIIAQKHHRELVLKYITLMNNTSWKIKIFTSFDKAKEWCTT